MPTNKNQTMPVKVIRVLRRIMPLCRDLTVDEQAWVTAACLKYLTMKIKTEVG